MAGSVSKKYDNPHDPPPKPEYVSVVESTMDVPGVQLVGPLMDRDCVACNGLIVVFSPRREISSALFTSYLRLLQWAISNKQMRNKASFLSKVRTSP